ncbi:beta-amylase [Orobanche minor]
MLSKNSCGVVLPGLDLSDEDQMIESRSSPELLLGHIMSCCRKNDVEVLGQNSLVTGGLRGFEKIEKNLMGENGVMGLFTYQRMGAYFFSPEHFPSFTRFVRGLNEPVRSSEDLPVEGEENAESLSGKNLQMQTA